MKALAEVYAQQLRTSLATMFQYRASLVIWLIADMLEPLIYLVVWTTVSRGNGGSAGGFSTADFAAYYLVLMVVNQVTYTWVMHEFEYRVQHGSLSFALLRPIHPIHTDIADNLSSKCVSMPIILAVAVGLSFAFHPVFRLSWWACALFVPALFLAFAVRFLLEWTLALAAFWTTRVSAINQMYFVVMLFLSGQIAPLALLPSPIRIAATVLPFRWIVSFPIELLLGGVSVIQACEGLAAQAVWLLAALALLRLMWRAGVRVYSAVGA